MKKQKFSLSVLKRIAFILLLTFISRTSFAQSPNWLWAKAMGGTAGYDYGYSIAIDPAGSGDVYTTGHFEGTVDFDPGPGTFNLTSAGSYDIFISRLDSSGNFIWAKAMGGSATDYGLSIALDPAGSGDVYTTGAFGGTADFDPGAGTFNLTSGSYDIFISKLDGSGNFVWAKAMGAIDYDHGYSIALDPAGSGNVYTTGYFRGTVDFDPGGGTFNLTSAGFSDIFISKLDGSGNFIWAKRMGGINVDNGYSIALDPAGSGDIYITGAFAGTVDFDPGAGTFNLTAAGTSQDIFISKLDASGNFIWAKRMGGTGSDYGYSITLDPAGSGDVYTTGPFMGTVDFDPGAGTFNLTSASIFNQDIFISKLDGSGNFIWAKQMGGTSFEYPHSIALDPAGSGDVYTIGQFAATVDFDPGAGTFNLTSAGGSYDIFISKLDGSGNFVWAKSIGAANYDVGLSIALDPAGSGDVYIAGGFQSPFVNFDAITLTNADNTGFTSDIFIAKLDVVTSIPLPVELISFNASFDKELDGVNLEWITASEINNDYFVIEHSRDGKNFQQIVQVDGAGNSISTLFYYAFDPGPETGINYYRLRQTDYDGKTSYSQIVTVNVDSKTQQITIYPNPAGQFFTIDVERLHEFTSALASKNKIAVTITGTTGEIIYSVISTESKMIEVNTKDFAGGVYAVQVQAPDFIETKKLIVVK